MATPFFKDERFWRSSRSKWLRPVLRKTQSCRRTACRSTRFMSSIDSLILSLSSPAIGQCRSSFAFFDGSTPACRARNCFRCLAKCELICRGLSDGAGNVAFMIGKRDIGVLG